MERRIIDLSKYRFGCCHEALGDARNVKNNQAGFGERRECRLS